MLSIALGVPQHLPPPETIQVTQLTLPELLPSLAQGHGVMPKILQQLGILIISPKKSIVGEMVIRLTVVWVHPYQAHISTLDEAVKKLALLTTSGQNWAYAFVWFNKDAQQVPLPKEGHLSAMIEGEPSRIKCSIFAS